MRCLNSNLLVLLLVSCKTVSGQDESFYAPTSSTGVGDQSVFSNEEMSDKIGQHEGGDDLSIDDDQDDLIPGHEGYDPYIKIGMKNEQTQVGPDDFEPVDPDIKPDVKPDVKPVPDKSSDQGIHPAPDGKKDGIHPVPDDSTDDVPEDDEEKVHLDMVDQSVKHMQDDQVTKVETVIVGIVISVAGFSLAFMGVQVMTAAFGLICSLFSAYVMISILCLIFGVNLGQIMGIIITIVGILASIPLGKRAMKVADIYAVPFFAGLMLFSFFGFVCKVIDINDRNFIRELIEVVGLFIGVYLGNKYKPVIKVLITALIGSNLGVYGAALALKWQPISPGKNKGIFVFYIFANIALFIGAYTYQRYQIKKLNSRIAAQANNTIFDGLNEDERRNQKLEKITAFLKTQNESFIGNQTTLSSDDQAAQGQDGKQLNNPTKWASGLWSKVGKMVSKGGKEGQEENGDRNEGADVENSSKGVDDSMQSECFFSEDNIKKNTITKYPVDNPKDDESESQDRRHLLNSSEDNSVRQDDD